MAVKTATIALEGGEMRFAGRADSGHTVILDNNVGNTGFRPAELIPVALAGCTAMDVISILRKKRQEVRGYEVHVEGVQMDDHPHAFTRFDVVHVVEGPDLDTDAVRRAIELSAAKYCSVGATLASGAVEIHHRYLCRFDSGEELAADVVVVGPHQDPVAEPAGVG